MGYSLFDKKAWADKIRSTDESERRSIVLPTPTGYVELNVPQGAVEEYEAREKRKFKPLDTPENLRSKLKGLADADEISDFALENDLCDYCDFGGLHAEAARCLVSVVLECCLKYPLLRAKTCFIGSVDAFCERMKEAAEGNGEVIVQFGLEKIIDDTSELKKIGEAAYVSMCAQKKKKDDYLAFASNHSGFFDAVVLDPQDFGSNAFSEQEELLKYNVEIGFHPEGCGSIEYVIYHEMGHLLDYILDVSNSDEFENMKKDYKPADITCELCRYAAYNSQEMLAEAFAEYFCNKKPRPLAKRIGLMSDRAYAAKKF